jgi:hypothetical protein
LETKSIRVVVTGSLQICREARDGSANGRFGVTKSIRSAGADA